MLLKKNEFIIVLQLKTRKLTSQNNSFPRQFFKMIKAPSPPGGVGGTKKFNTERLCPEVRPLTLLYTIFDLKGIPFVITFH